MVGLDPTIHYHPNWMLAHFPYILFGTLCVMLCLIVLLLFIKAFWGDRSLSEKKLGRMSEERKRLAQTYFEKHNEPITRSIIWEMEAEHAKRAKKRQILERQQAACSVRSGLNRTLVDGRRDGVHTEND